MWGHPRGTAAIGDPHHSGDAKKQRLENELEAKISEKNLKKQMVAEKMNKQKAAARNSSTHNPKLLCHQREWGRLTVTQGESQGS